MSELDDPFRQQFSDDELRVIVEEAARAERVVAAHCHGKAGILAALRAGCHTIEHGTELDEESAAAMREQGAVLVPTRTAFEGMLAMRQALPPAWQARVDEFADRHLKAIRLAIESGVRIATGTDLGLSIPGTPLSWGAHGAELGHLVAAGLRPLEAIAAATADAPGTLGPQAPRSGLLAPGHDADLIALDSDPLDDISVLADPRHVTHVWKFGEPVKEPRG